MFYVDVYKKRDCRRGAKCKPSRSFECDWLYSDHKNGYLEYMTYKTKKCVTYEDMDILYENGDCLVSLYV